VATAVDDDTKAGFVTRWKATAGLLAAFATGPVSGNLPSPQPSLYVGIACEQGPQPNEYYAPVATGAPYIDYRKVTLTIRGIEATVSDVVNKAAAAYSWKSFTIPGATQLMHCLPLDDGRMEKDPDRKSGEEIWLGVLTYEVMTQRVVV